MKNLDVAHCIVTLLLASLVALLCYSNYRNNEVLHDLTENVNVQNQLDILRLLQPCVGPESAPPKFDFRPPEMEKQSADGMLFKVRR